MAALRRKARGGWLNSLIFIALSPVYLVSKLFPRDRNLYLFGSGHGERFADNSKYLFLHFARNPSDNKYVFVSRNRQVVNSLTDAGYEALDISTWKGKLTALRAGTCFISHSTHDIHPLLIGGARIVQLWHGTPLKKIAYDSMRPPKGLRQGLKYWVRRIAFRLFPYLNASTCFDHLVVSSENVVDCFMSAFRLTRDEVEVLGQCRNDSLIAGYDFDGRIFPEFQYLESFSRKRKRVVTWMPTHRLISGGGIASLIENYQLDQSDLIDVLVRHNAQLVIKAHPLDLSQIKDRQFLDSRIAIYPYDDPYPLLRTTDILITDYSSVYLDFLLLDRPMIFSSFDYETYMKDDAAMYFDYEKVTPGPKCSNWIELTRELDSLLSVMTDGGEDRYCQSRKSCREMFNKFVGGNCLRVAQRFENK